MADRVARFAPSPTGPLHLGHAFAALVAASRADRFLLRIEDIDPTRCKPEWEAAIYDDLRWLGLAWEVPVMHQSARLAVYQDALTALHAMGLTYACTCTRADIKAALSAPQEGAMAPMARSTPAPAAGGRAMAPSALIWRKPWRGCIRFSSPKPEPAPVPTTSTPIS